MNVKSEKKKNNRNVLYGWEMGDESEWRWTFP